MTVLIATDSHKLVIGLGVTGMSVVRYLCQQGQRFSVFDTRNQPPNRPAFESEFPEVPLYLGEVPLALLDGIDEIVLSPGIPRSHDLVCEAIRRGISVVGDIDLFLRDVKAPVVGITGSNGKTTVTTLVGGAAEKAGLKVAIGGNIGVPALSLLDDACELYVLELSSFQLENLKQPNLSVACCLNLSADHMDRYDSMQAYRMAKHRIFNGARKVVYNLDDILSIPLQVENVERFGFTVQPRQEINEKLYFWNQQNQIFYIDGESSISLQSRRLSGLHNVQNLLAVIAILDALAIQWQGEALEYLLSFKGLPHRCEWVAKKLDLTFVNDSKATNVGAAIAALEGLQGDYSGITLIAGGDGKGADFSHFSNKIVQCCTRVILLGRDASAIAQALNHRIPCIVTDSLESAVHAAIEQSLEGDLVLLSPACASLDMFPNYEVRGNGFKQIVEAL